MEGWLRDKVLSLIKVTHLFTYSTNWWAELDRVQNIFQGISKVVKKSNVILEQLKSRHP